MADKNQQLVLAIFKSEDDARFAANTLKMWDKANDDIKAGAVGIIARDKKGKLKEDLLGARAGGKGAKIGTILGVVAAIPTGGLSLLGGVAGGAVGGGVLGSMFHKKLGLSDDYKAYLNREIDGGKAAVGVLVPADEAPTFTSMLKELGGVTEASEVSAEADATVDAAVEAAVAAEATGVAPAVAVAEGVAAADAGDAELAAVSAVAVAVVAAGAVAEGDTDEAAVAAAATDAAVAATDAAVADETTEAPQREGSDFSPTSVPDDGASGEVL